MTRKTDNEFGGPTQDESACEMAIRVLREQKIKIEQLTQRDAKTQQLLLEADTREMRAEAEVERLRAALERIDTLVQGIPIEDTLDASAMSEKAFHCREIARAALKQDQ